MAVVIPLIELTTNSSKKGEFQNDTGTDSTKLTILAIVDLCLFVCILIELLTAMLWFWCLSKKYKIKFQINQVLVHIAMIVTISISRFTGWYSESYSIDIHNGYTRRHTMEDHLLFPVDEVRRLIIFWIVSLVFYVAYFSLLMYLLL